MEDRYPSTDEHQAVHLDFPYPDVSEDLNRWLPLVGRCSPSLATWCCCLLYVAAIFVVIAAWFAVLFTGRFPRGMFDFLVGVGRWTNRVVGYAHVLVTDRYRLSASPRRCRPSAGWRPVREGLPSTAPGSSASLRKGG